MDLWPNAAQRKGVEVILFVNGIAANLAERRSAAFASQLRQKAIADALSVLFLQILRGVLAAVKHGQWGGHVYFSIIKHGSSMT